jgi:hypothetical protein
MKAQSNAPNCTNSNHVYAPPQQSNTPRTVCANQSRISLSTATELAPMKSTTSMTATALALPIVCIVGCKAAPSSAVPQTRIEQPERIWKTAGAGTKIDLNSIRRPGEGDDFWHVDGALNGESLKTFSFDCYVGHVFPNGEVPSEKITEDSPLADLYEVACAPPSQIEKLKVELKVD